MILYFLVQPLGLDPKIIDRCTQMIINERSVLPLIGFTDSETLQVPGIYKLPDTDSLDYDYTAYFEPTASIKYCTESFEIYEENKHIWPIIDYGSPVNIITSGTIEMLYRYYIKFKDNEHIDIIPILITTDYKKRINAFYEYYADTRGFDFATIYELYVNNSIIYSKYYELFKDKLTITVPSNAENINSWHVENLFGLIHDDDKENNKLIMHARLVLESIKTIVEENTKEEKK